MGAAYQYKRVSDDASNRLEVVGQLAAGIAHEINTPVQYIGDNLRYVSDQLDILIELVRRYQSLSELIQSDDILRKRYSEIQEFSVENDVDFLAEEVPAAISQSMMGVETISAIVRSMRSLVHSGTREKVLIDVNESIENAVLMSKGSWKHCLDLQTDLAQHLPKVECYEGELSQVLINLIVNATHAIEETSERGTIEIRSYIYKNSVGIQIQDSGTGIPIEIQHRIFDPFFSSKDVGRGTGQGLAFAHSSIVERNGGTLFFETMEGEGTTFHIYLPVEAPSQETELR
ncbi:MAG: ATP-binding protein [Pseudomonadota bacterium]